MTKESTQIKSIIESHLRRQLFGMTVYGSFEIPTHDTFTLIEVRGATRFEKYGTATVYHPAFGKWIVTLHDIRRSVYIRGTPRQVLTAEEIKTYIAEQRTLLDSLYRVYDVPMPEYKPVIWDLANYEAKS